MKVQSVTVEERQMSVNIMQPDGSSGVNVWIAEGTTGKEYTKAQIIQKANAILKEAVKATTDAV